MTLYHREAGQEDFLVLRGECVLVIEGEERTLRAWDFVHCPPETAHTIIAAGAEPALIVAVGARRERGSARYPFEPAAAKHGAGVPDEQTSGRDHYATFGTPHRSGPRPLPRQMPGRLTATVTHRRAVPTAPRDTDDRRTRPRGAPQAADLSGAQERASPPAAAEASRSRREQHRRREGREREVGRGEAVAEEKAPAIGDARGDLVEHPLDALERCGRRPVSTPR